MFSLNLARLCQSATNIIALLAIAGFFIMFTAANSPLLASSQNKAEIVPCDIKLVFSIDDSGMSLVSYNLEMQVSNRQGRTIKGISVHWLDRSAKIIGNSDTLCGQDQCTGADCRRAGDSGQ